MDIKDRYTPISEDFTRKSISRFDPATFSSVRKQRKKYSIGFYCPIEQEFSSWKIVGEELASELDRLGIPTYFIPWVFGTSRTRLRKRILPRGSYELKLEDIHFYVNFIGLRAIVRISHPDSFHVMLPLREHFPNLKLIGYSVVESDSMNECWVSGCNSMDQVWGTSQFTCDVYRKSGVKVPIVYVPHGVRTEIFKPENADRKLRKKLKLDDKFVILFVGRCDERKNLPALIRSYAMIERPDTHLVIHGDKLSKDVALIKKLGIKNVTYTEDFGIRIWKTPHRKMPKIYGLALGKRRGCHVLPSHAEGFGMTLIEAGSMALPCIAVNWSAVPEIIQDKQTGLLIPVSGFEEVPPFITSGGRWAVFEEEELAGLIELLYANPSLCQELGDRARDHVRKNFTWRRAAERAFTALSTLISHKEIPWMRIKYYRLMNFLRMT